MSLTAAAIHGRVENALPRTERSYDAPTEFEWSVKQRANGGVIVTFDSRVHIDFDDLDRILAAARALRAMGAAE